MNQSHKDMKTDGNSNIKGFPSQTYFKSRGFYTAGFKFVEISIEHD